MTNHIFYDAPVLLVSIGSETLIFLYCSMFIIHTKSRLNRGADYIYHVLQKQT